MLARLAVLAVAVSARKTGHRSRALTTAEYDRLTDPHKIISQCIQFKEEGAFWDRTKELQKSLFHEIKAKEIVVLIPADVDNMTATDHSAPRQYARVIQAYEALNERFDVKVVGYFLNATGDGKWTALPEDTGKQVFVAFGMPPAFGDMLHQMHSRSSKMLLIHDSLCFEENSPQKNGYSTGCPLLASDFVDAQKHGVPSGTFFTPWGTETSKVWLEKSAEPSIIIDATHEWTKNEALGLDLQVGNVVKTFRDKFPSMKIVVLSDGEQDLWGAKDIEVYTERLPLEDFLQHLRESWFFVTGIASSYELSLSDAAMAGAVLVDVNRASKRTVSPPATVHLDNSTSLSSVIDDAVRRFKEEELAFKTRKWAEAFHGETYVGLNLACALFADQQDHQQWTDLQFNTPST